MKRRFVECAILLGVVMSVMLLAQTQEVIGHDRINPKTQKEHKPPGHNHLPSVRVDSDGNPLQTGAGGDDPRGEHFSGTCGKTEDGVQSAWGFRYGGGTYATSPSGPDCDTQNVWSLRVDTEASTGEKHARVKVTPSIYLTHFHLDEESWQGAARGTVQFSKVNYHKQCFLGTTPLPCNEYAREVDYWSEGGFLDMKVKTEKIAKEKTKKYGANFESHGASLTAESEDKYTTSYDDLHARGYYFILELKVGLFDGIAKYQDKSATGIGHLMSGHVQSDTATAEYKYTDWDSCYLHNYKRPRS